MSRYYDVSLIRENGERVTVRAHGNTRKTAVSRAIAKDVRDRKLAADGTDHDRARARGRYAVGRIDHVKGEQ